jgi:hypothetical protein
MRTFTVHEPPGAGADRLERAEELVFVEDGFSWAAALLAPFWLIANRLWLPLVAYVVAFAILQALIWLLGIPQQLAGWLMIAMHALIGFEADSIRRWALGRRGWRMVGSVNGRTIEDCERRFLDGWLAGDTLAPAVSVAGSSRSGAGRLDHTAFWRRRG